MYRYTFGYTFSYTLQLTTTLLQKPATIYIRNVKPEDDGMTKWAVIPLFLTSF